MRLLAAAATIVACLAASFAVNPRYALIPNIHHSDNRAAAAVVSMEKQARKRPDAPGPDNDSCRLANDNVCDDPDIGTGACRRGTDRTDCSAVAWMRDLTDRCVTAFNGICEEPGAERSGTCAARTDRADCHGRERPLTINDHFFGRDDRVLVNANEAPWRMMGALLMDAGKSCTATLIARDVIITAAHCIHTDEGRINAAASFKTADRLSTARVTAYLIDPRFNYERFHASDDVDGMDWALLRLDQPLGDRVGFAGVRNLTGEGSAAALAADLQQAGYSWDTGENLSGNLGCRIVAVNRDNTFAHECDTTRGDSGSAFVVRNTRGGYDVVGTDSKFRSNPDGPFVYIAVSASAWAARAPDFIAGRTGTPVGRQVAGGGRK